MSLNRPKLKVIISGGGTGGHIFPAIAIANALKKMNPANEFLFVGANGRMEMEKVPAAGYKIEGLNISGIQRKLTIKNLMLPFRVIASVLKSKKIIRSFSPDVAVGVGGYASGPLLYAATRMHIPTVIQEQNSFAGITNKILSKRVDRIFVAYDNMESFFPKNKITISGNPVRQEVADIEGKQKEAFEFFQLNPEKNTILIIGGSLGARTINDSILQSLKKFVDAGVQIIWQTGKGYNEKAKEAVASLSTSALQTFDFIHRMDLAYAAATIIISRAGASSVSELALIGKPVILVPSPNVAEDHQTKNAIALVNRNAAILVGDQQARSELTVKAFELLNNQEMKATLSANIKHFARKDAAKKIAEDIYLLVDKKNHN